MRWASSFEICWGCCCWFLSFCWSPWSLFCWSWFWSFLSWSCLFLSWSCLSWSFLSLSLFWSLFLFLSLSWSLFLSLFWSLFWSCFCCCCCWSFIFFERKQGCIWHPDQSVWGVAHFCKLRRFPCIFVLSSGCCPNCTRHWLFVHRDERLLLLR